MMKIGLLAPGAALVLLASGSALGANPTSPATGTFQVTATVLKACTVSATPLGFGNYTPTGGAAAGTSTISVACTKTSPYTVTLNGGSTPGGTISQRLMTNGTQTLQYNLYTSTAYSTLVGDGTTGIKLSGIGAGLAAAVNTTIYGQLPDVAANQSVPAGVYTDTVTVSVAY